MKRVLAPLAGLALVGAGLAAGITVSATAADDDPAPVTVTRQSLAEVAAPPGAPKRTLGLSKVTVMPGAELASHHHPGAQLGYVAEGALTYTVESGHAQVFTGSGDDPTLVKKLGPGDTFKVKAGQWLSEEQDEVHHATNAGTVPIVIYISTLLRTGRPAAIPD
ncbi:cupin domain-containing protein [Nocardioides mangrovi]|uniref:Cupin domain-containing protein n=1 Tax=Nocardioides mangrovi TaxID=2874580 RepID=A0ABS7UFF5_9ACTN|nr:cupin domain-containing protein [Nocardioides mangrovi]MBZ5739517.1 cupin domain-containing protein [Nocardioides mangrovi]